MRRLDGKEGNVKAKHGLDGLMGRNREKGLVLRAIKQSITERQKKTRKEPGEGGKVEDGLPESPVRVEFASGKDTQMDVTPVKRGLRKGKCWRAEIAVR